MSKRNLPNLTRTDVAQVLRIERESKGSPWSEDHFSLALARKKCFIRVADVSNLIAGFIVYERHDSFVQILNIAVDPKMQMNGVGRHLVREVKAIAIDSPNRAKVRIVLTESDVGAQLFFKKMQFTATATLPGHFGDEDGYLFVWNNPER